MRTLRPGCGAGTRLGVAGLRRPPRGWGGGAQGAAPPWKSAPFAVTLRVRRGPGWVAPCECERGARGPRRRGEPGVGAGTSWRASSEPPQPPVRSPSATAPQPASLCPRCASPWGAVGLAASPSERTGGAGPGRRDVSASPLQVSGQRCWLPARQRPHCGSAARGGRGLGAGALCIATRASRALWGRWLVCQWVSVCAQMAKR